MSEAIVAVTATIFTDVINDSALTAEIAEQIMNTAVDTLNIFRCNISRLTGTAGSQTVNWTSQQLGAVQAVSRAIYASYYKNAANQGSMGISSLNVSTTDLMSNSTVWQMISDIADQFGTHPKNIQRSFQRTRG
jgi:hypothetical protein